MTKIHNLRLLALASLGATAALAAAPALADESYFYGGLGVATSRGKLDAAGLTAAQLPVGTVAVSSAIDDRETAYKVFGGYQLNRWVGFEFGYFSLGKFTTHAVTDTGGTPGTLDGKLNFKGLNLDVVGTAPIADKFSLIGRLGTQIARNRSSYTAVGFSPNDASPNNRNTNYKVGVGLQYEIDPAVLLRTEIERYRVKEAPGNHGIVNTWSISLVFPFGRQPKM